MSFYICPWTAQEKGVSLNFSSLPLGFNTSGNPGTSSSSFAKTTINTINQWTIGGVYFEQYNTTESTAAMPTMATADNNGINIDAITGAPNKTIEITQGNAISISNAFRIGEFSGVSLRVTLNVNTIANVENLYIGFRKVQPYQAILPTGYTDYATFGINGRSGRLQIQTQKNSDGNFLRDTRNIVPALTDITLQINVAANGVVTFLQDVTGNGPLIPPRTTNIYTFTERLMIIPYIIYTTASSHSEVNLVTYTCNNF